MDDIQFCFVISSFNNESNITNNLTSVITQRYTNWRCIYINDCSTDKTEELFFDLIKKYNVESQFIYKKNDKRSGQAYSKHSAYRIVKDFEIVCILDGDDWLSDVNVLTRLKQIYSNKNIRMVSSNYTIWYSENKTEDYSFSAYSQDIIDNKKFRRQEKWLARHLKTGYGIFFKSIPKEYLKMNTEWLKVATDIAEYYSALELNNGIYLPIDDVMYIYNKSNSLNYTTSYYREESKNIHKKCIDYIRSLPPCKYRFPKTYIINMAKCTEKRKYIEQQMLFQSNKNVKFISAVDGSINSETGRLMKKYFDYMNIKNSSQQVAFDRSKMESSYKIKYNFKRQHITHGSLGLLQSAFLVMNEFIKSNNSHILILEDDVYTIQDLHKNLFINNELLKGKDLVYLGCHTSNHNIYPEKSDNIFIDLSDCKDLIYGTYSIIISKNIAEYILSLGLDTIIQLNLSWDLFLNYVRDTQGDKFKFFLYFKQIFIPNVIKTGGINPLRDISFYTKNKIQLRNYYIPGVTSKHTETQIAQIMSTHNEKKFFEFIDKAVYINLQERVDRKKHVETELLKYINRDKVIRFDAIKNAKGAIGCGLSHIAVLEMAIEKNWNNVFIVEDDLKWTNHFKKGHNVLEDLIEKEYDVIVLGGTFIKSFRDSFKLISCNCALAYIVNKSYYKKLLECFKNAVDGLIVNYSQHLYAIDQAWKPLQRSDNWFIIKPNMCIQLPNYSNIENTFTDYTNYFNKDVEYDLPSDQLSVVNSQDTEISNNLFKKSHMTPKIFNPGTSQDNNSNKVISDIHNDNNSTQWNKYLRPRNITISINNNNDKDNDIRKDDNTTQLNKYTKPRNVTIMDDNNKNNNNKKQEVKVVPSIKKVNDLFKSKINIVNHNIQLKIPYSPPVSPNVNKVSFKRLMDIIAEKKASKNL